MTPSQIEGFIDRIAGLFPTSQVARNTVKNTWTGDDFLLFQTLDDARKVVPLIMDTHNKFPSLKEVHECFRALRHKGQPFEIICGFCDNTGWIYATDEQGVRKTKTNGLKDKNQVLLEYEYVVRCECFTTK